MHECGIENSQNRHFIPDRFALKSINRDSIFPLKFLDRTFCNSRIAFTLPEHITTPCLFSIQILLVWCLHSLFR